MAVTAIRAEDIEMTHRSGPPRIAEFDQCSIQWQVHYDEVVHVLEGVFRLQSEGQIFEARVGDTMWIPKDTKLSYEGDRARIFYAVYPGNWCDRLT